MTKTGRILLGVGLSALVLTALFFGARWMLTKATVAGPGPQISESGGIQVMASHDPANQKQGTVTFTLALTSHSVELGGFEVTKLSRVIVEPGGPATDLRWTPKGATSGHHIEGTLTAKVPPAPAGAKTFALEIQGLGSPEVRRFEWPVEAR